MTIFVKCFNCGRMEIPFKYLGTKIGGNPKILTFFGSQSIRSSLDCLHGIGGLFL